MDEAALCPFRAFVPDKNAKRRVSDHRAPKKGLAGQSRLRNVAERLAASGNYSPEFVEAFCAPVEPSDYKPGPGASGHSRSKRRYDEKRGTANGGKGNPETRRKRERYKTAVIMSTWKTDKDGMETA